MESGGAKQEMLQQMCFKDCLKDAKQELRSEMYKMFLRCILSFKMQRYANVLMFAPLSLHVRRFVFPMQLVTDTASTCVYKCYSKCSNH